MNQRQRPGENYGWVVSKSKLPELMTQQESVRRALSCSGGRAPWTQTFTACLMFTIMQWEINSQSERWNKPCLQFHSSTAIIILTITLRSWFCYTKKVKKKRNKKFYKTPHPLQRNNSFDHYQGLSFHSSTIIKTFTVLQKDCNPFCSRFSDMDSISNTVHIQK